MINFSRYNKMCGLLFVFSSLTICSFLILSSSSVSADATVSATATVTVGSACTLHSSVDTPHVATIPSGTNKSEIGKTTFTMACNDTGGYSIYAIGYSNNEMGNTKLLANINGSLNPTYDINTGTNASGTPSSWAMKLTPSTNLTSSNILNGYDSYSVVPSSYVKVASLVPTTTPVSTSDLEATYRVNIASTQPAGNYNARVRYVMVNPATNVPNEPKTCAANKICYWPNAGSEVVDSMGDQSITSSATSATLWPSNFQRPGYGFAGWSDKFDWELNANDANGNGTGANEGYHIYGPMADIEFTAGQYSSTNGGLSLYAVWVKSEGNLQGWNGCGSLGQGKVTALSDQRDGDTYAVAKLADGNCWMIENLRLDADDSKDSSLAQGFGGVFAGLANPETANFTNTTSYSPIHIINSLYYSGAQSGTATIDIGIGNYPDYRIPRYRDDNTTSPVANMSSTSANIYSYGNYYTWAAAKANTQFLDTMQNSIAENTSLCPSGWRLPQGGNKTRIESNDDNDIWNLIVDGLNNGTQPANYSSNTEPYYTGSDEAGPVSKLVRKFPSNFIYSGIADRDSLSRRGSNGSYWSSTASSWALAYYLGLEGTGVYTGSIGLHKYDGYSIRCVLHLQSGA